MRYTQNPDFMKRASLKAEEAPSIKNPDNSISTHRMAAEKYKGEWYAFPTIIQGKDGKLSEYEDPFKALKENLKTGNVMRFGKDKDAAIKFAKGQYKEGTPMQSNPVLNELMKENATGLISILSGVSGSNLGT